MSPQVPPLFMLMHKGNRKPKRSLGILDIKPCQGRGLRVVQKIGKQDPFIKVEHGIRSQRTKADKNGGQKPRWEDNIKFDLFEGDTVVRVQCLDQNIRDNSLIGQLSIDFSPVLKSHQWDGWFGLTWQGMPAGDVYLEFTYYPSQDIPKPVNPPKPAVHRITLTPAEILSQMKESEDALPPLSQHSNSVDPPNDAEEKHSKNLTESPKSEPSIDTIQDELNDIKLGTFGADAESRIHYESSPDTCSSNSLKNHMTSSCTPTENVHNHIHRHSEPNIYSYGHFFPYTESGSSESLTSPYLMSSSSQLPRVSDIRSNDKASPLLVGIHRPLQSAVDRRRSKLIGPRRANSSPQEETPEFTRTNISSPSPSQLCYEYIPIDHRYSYPYKEEFPNNQERSSYLHSYTSTLDAYPQFPSSPFPPPAPGVEYPVGPAFMMSPHMYSDPSYYDENFRALSTEAAIPTNCW